MSQQDMGDLGRVVQVELPAEFQVGARVPPVYGGGKLTIDRGVIVLELNPLTRAMSGRDRIVHTNRSVALVTARLMVPWANTSLVLFDEETTACAVTWWKGGSRWRAPLVAAGFEVGEWTAWSMPYAAA